MNDFTSCHRVIGIRRCGGKVEFRDDLPTCRVKVCKRCGFKYFFPPSYEQEVDFHATYPPPEYQADEGAAVCKLGK